MAKDLENTMVGNNIHLFTKIDPDTTNGLIVQLIQWVNALPYKDKEWKTYSPNEEIPNNIPVLNVWINSGGGNAYQTTAILNMFNLASARGTIIRTYNICRAASSASMIAVSGTPGYRYMAENAYNLVHYGNSRYEISHSNELEYALNDAKTHDEKTRRIYLNNTKLTMEEIDQFYNTENSGQLYAEQCLQKGLCDWVITNDGRFVNTVEELKKQKTR